MEKRRSIDVIRYADNFVLLDDEKTALDDTQKSAHDKKEAH